MEKILLCCLILVTGSSAFAQNVGIGTINPQAKLHVAGPMRVDTLAGGGKHLVYADVYGNLITQNTGLVGINAQSGSIPYTCAAGGISRSINISNQPVTVSTANIRVRVKINHTYDSDLAGYLIAPNGSVLNLFYLNGSSGDNFTNTIFTDAAGTSISSGSAPFSGNYKPLGSLLPVCSVTPTVTTFAGIAGGSIIPNGVWTLKIFDIVSGDDGDLIDWGITFNGSQPPVPDYIQDGYSVRSANGAFTAGSILDNGSGNITVTGNITTNTLTLNNVGVTGDFLIKDNTSTGVGSQKGMGGTGINYIIALVGLFPPSGGGGTLYSEQILGEVRMFAGNFAPSGWAFCNGQLLPITGNEALFSLLGTIYGGNGASNFALPDLRGSVPVHPGTSLKGSDWSQGERN